MTTTYTPSVRNITRVFRAATAADIDAGADWYRDANNVAGALALKHGVTADIAAGVIAAVSPLNSWGNNVNLAARILAAGGTLTTGGLRANIAKANRIILGERVTDVLTSDKVKNFYLAIVSNGQAGVCIDRHAFDIAVGKRLTDDTRPGNIKGKRYSEIALAYVRAAQILSAEYDIELSPAQVQSVTWTEWSRRFWARGAFDAYEAI